jgi:hypothetical protein
LWNWLKNRNRSLSIFFSTSSTDPVEMFL